MTRATVIAIMFVGLIVPANQLHAQDVERPTRVTGSTPLPDRYPYVAKDILKYCQPKEGFWIDLGAGKGQVGIPLIEATNNPVTMLDPDVKAMSKGLEIAREKGLEHRLFAVVGVAEDMPFSDNSVDLVVSHGSIFFWDDQVKGLQEVHRVLRPGGKAMIGGGVGSTYPQWAVEEYFRRRQEQFGKADTKKKTHFGKVRSPETFRRWAEDAKLPSFEITGKGALSVGDPKAGLGIWLRFTKQQK